MTKDNKFSAKVIKAYVNNYGNHCPHCKSENIEAGEVIEPEHGLFTQKVTCFQCNKEWTDKYFLKTIEPLLTINQFAIGLLMCKKCGSVVEDDRCTDETCPYSDYGQNHIFIK
jgi:predicted Zn-ribbon and HTH transcriptional regulator